MRVAVLTATLAAFALFGLLGSGEAKTAQLNDGASVTLLNGGDFVYGTYIIDEPGVYQLTEDISFNPNSPATLTAAIASGMIPAGLAAAMGMPMSPEPVDAYHAGFPLFTQFVTGGVSHFTPGGPLDPRYDPAAFGLGFFAAIVITADEVVLDLQGHTIEQSAEHALLQRFFAVVELADQPFVPSQGPAGFGEGIDSARHVVIKNGTIGRSSHHGIHGNGNEDIAVMNVAFRDYEIAAVALNGVKGLEVSDVTATNRKDVPILGTFSSAQFIKVYIEELDRTGSMTTLSVAGVSLGVAEIKAALLLAINNTHADIVAQPNIVDGRAQIDSAAHPVEYELFHNPFGVVDGNSYSFLVNSFGVAVDGFPFSPDGDTRFPSEDVRFRNVHVSSQRAFINEIVAIDVGGGVAAIDPVGAVFQVRNLHPDTGEPITISDSDSAVAKYLGNPVANAQAFVAKAARNGDFASSPLDISRLNIPEQVLRWVEGQDGSSMFSEIGLDYVCNGDSMFHVNKGVIAFKMDAAKNVQMVDTSVNGLANLGAPGSSLCGDYREDYSHSKATLPGYGGATVRGYTFSGSQDVVVINSSAQRLSAKSGSAIGFDILTDASRITLFNVSVDDVDAGWGTAAESGPNRSPRAVGFHIGPEAENISIVRGVATSLAARDTTMNMDDETGAASVVPGWDAWTVPGWAWDD